MYVAKAMGDTGGSKVECGEKKREDGKVEYGYALMRGKRSQMEDFTYADFVRDASGRQVGCFGVFDGHGGPDAAHFVRDRLLHNIMQHKDFNAYPEKAIEESFLETDKQYLASEGANDRDDGCTAAAMVIREQDLYLGHVGDSRAVLFRNGECVQLSNDHKPNIPEERERIEKMGGVVIWAGTWRVGGVLAVSRAFGDRLLKDFVVARPDLRHEKLGAGDVAVVLATDGIWDVITNEDARGIIEKAQSAKDAAKDLAEQAYQRGSNDNISCIVVKFFFE